MISDTLFSMNAITNDQKVISKEYSDRLKEIRSILGKDHFEIIKQYQ